LKTEIGAAAKMQRVEGEGFFDISMTSGLDVADLLLSKPVIARIGSGEKSNLEMTCGFFPIKMSNVHFSRRRMNMSECP
jgi:hypothetical protein